MIMKRRRLVLEVLPSLIIVISQLLTIILKLAGVLTCSWFSVFLPTILPIVLIIGAVLGIGIVFLVDYFLAIQDDK